MSELPPDFADLLLALSDAEARFMVVGGYAVAHYGHVRATKDIDVWVCPTPGQTVQLGVPPLRIDLLTEIAGVDFETAWANRREFDVAGHSIPIIGRVQLLANKRATGRPKDLDDVEALERSDR